MKRISIVLALFAAAGAHIAHAQVTMPSTTLSQAVLDSSGTRVALVSYTGVTAGTTYLYVDRELMFVSAAAPTGLTVQRGASGTSPSPHVSGATVYFGPGNYFSSHDFAGTCTNDLVLPHINYVDGQIFDCTGGVYVSRNSGGGGNATVAGYTTVTYSSTPTFSVSSNTGHSFLITLTGDVSSSTVNTTGITNSGKPVVTFRICQDSSGSHAFAWPSNVQNHGSIDSTASACSTQTFVWDGTNFQALGVMVVTGINDAVTLPGSTSGSTKLQASATASGVLTLPARTANVATTSGSLINTHCGQFDSNGNITDSGGTCGGSGSVTANPPFLVTIGSTNYVAPYMTQQTPFSTTGYSTISGTPTITTLGNGVVSITTGDGTTSHFYGKTLAGTESSLVLGFSGGCVGGDYGQAGIFAAESTSNKLWNWAIACNGGSTHLLLNRFLLSNGSYDSFAAFNSPSNYFDIPAYLKIDWSSSTVNFSVSHDGGGTWVVVQTYSTTTLFGSAIKPTNVGISLQGSSSGQLTRVEIVHYVLQ